MNRIYRVIWNSSIGVWQAVSEIGKSAGKKKNHGRRHRTRLSLIAGSVFIVSAQAYADALPTNGTVSLGSGSISQPNGKTLNITQNTNKIAIDWQSFSVGKDSVVNFIQPSSSSVALNRVTGSDVSSIQGAINANGQVFLINPNGVLFDTTAQVNVGGLIASTRDLTNENFSADNFIFEGSNGNAVINRGSLVATDGGYVVMIAAKVQNMGDIVANQGSVQLAAGDSVLVNLGGTVSIEVKQGAIDALILNGGAIKADGGHILFTAKAAGDLAASVVNNTGIVEATSLVSQGGEIVFMGDDITNSGTIVADGATGGGEILIGGDWQGENAEQYPHATKVTLTETSQISASATTQGDGGKVVVWSDVKSADSVTKVAGNIRAQGLGENTNGGKIETSGHVLNVAKGTTVEAAEWLLDPTNITISAGSDGSLTDGETQSDIGAETIETALNAGTNVTVQTDSEVAGEGDITLAANISKSSGADATLTLTAANNIVINENVSITSTTGALKTVLRADNDINSSGSVSMGAGSSIDTNGGDVWIGGATDTSPAASVTTQAISAAAGSVKILSTGDISLGSITSTGSVELSSSGTVTQTGAITGGQNVNLLGTGGTYTLTNTSNAIGSLAADTGSLNVTNNQDFSLGSIVTTGDIELSSTGAVTQTGAITGGQALNLQGSGSYTLTNAGNEIASLAANTGSLSITNNQGFSLGSIETTGAVKLSSTGTVTQTDGTAITGGQALNLLGTEGTYILTNANNEIGTLTANTGSVELVSGSAQTTGAITTTGSLRLTSDALTINGDIDAGAGDITFNTDALTVTSGTVKSTGALQIAAKTASATIGIGGGTGTLQVTATNFSTDFVDGFSEITIGGENQSGNIDVDATVLKDALTLQTTGNITQNGAITGDQNLTLIGGGTHTLNNADNAIGQLTATSGALTFHGTEFTLGNIATTGAIQLSSTGTVTQASDTAITGDQALSLFGVNGAYTLNNMGNEIASLAANTGSLSVTNNHNFSLGSIITTGDVELSSTGEVTQTGAIIGDQALNLLGTGTYTLNNTGNEIASLAANTGSLSVTNNHDFTLGSIVTTGDVTLSSDGTVTQTGAITGGQALNLQGAGTYTLTNTGNEIASLAANTGTLSVTNNHDFSLGTIATTGAVELSSTGTVTQTGAITGDQTLNLLGTGTYTLTNENNEIGTLTADTGSVELVNSSAQTTGAITTTGALNLTSDALTINENIATGAGNITFNTDSLTIASDKTVTGSGTLQVATKSVATTIGVNGGSGALQISTADFADGFSAITIGSADHTGGIEIGANTTLNDATTLQTGGILSVNNDLDALANNLTLKVGQLTIADDKTISGTGVLTVASETDSEAIDIGGTSQQLNAADFGSKIANGFSDIVIGGADQTGGINIVEDSTLAAAVTMQTSGALSVDHNLAAGANNLTLKVGELSVADGKAISGSGTLNIASDTASDAISIVDTIDNTAVDTLQLLSADFVSKIADGFSGIVIGDSSQSGNITIGATAFNDALTLQSTGTVTQTGAITGGQDLNLLGSGGTHTLTNAGNAIGNLTANTGSVELVNSLDQTTGAITTSGALNLTSDALTINENIATGAGNITFNTDALTIADGKTVAGSGNLQITTKTVDKLIDVGGATADALQLTTTNISTDFADGFANITIGSADHTGGIEIGADTTFKDAAILQTSGALSVSNNLAAGANNLTLKVSELSVADGKAISGSGTLNITSDAASDAISIVDTIDNNAVDTLQLLSADFASKIADGFSGIVIGDSSQSGNITIGATAFNDALTLQSTGTVTQTGAITGGQDLNLLGAGGTHTLTDEGNSIGTLTANTGSVEFVSAKELVGAADITTETSQLGSMITSGALSVSTVDGGITVSENLTAGGALTLTSAKDITVESGKTLTSPESIALYGANITQKGTLDASSTTTNGGNITLAKDASTAADFISLEGVLNASTTNGTGGTIITNGQSVFLNTSANVTTAGNTANGTWKTPVSTFDTVVAATGGDITGQTISDALKTANYKLIASADKVTLSEKLATQNTLKNLTDAAITSADFGGITINDSITKVSAGTSGTAPQPVYDITTDTTLTVTSTSNITVNGAISSEQQRLNLILTANNDATGGGDVIFGSNGSVTTNNGNFYVGSVTLGQATNGVGYAYNDQDYHDIVTASAENFTMNTGSQINVGSGSLVLKVTDDINLPTGDAAGKSFSINSTAGSSGYNNETETNANRSGTPSYEQVATVPTSLTLEAGGSIIGASTDSTKISTNSSSAMVNVTSAENIGSADSPVLFSSNNGTINITNTVGNSYIKFANASESSNFSTLNLTTDVNTKNTTQRIEFNSDGSHRLLATTDANGLFSIATGGFVDETSSKNITIKAPNITLANGAIVATGGSTSVDSSDKALLNGTGLNLTLTALSGSTYGEIKADNAAEDYSSGTAPSDFANKEVYLPNGTLTLNALDIGVKVNSDDWSNALEVTANTLNINNSGGSTWLRNSDYNSLNFSSAGVNTTVGNHHILSTNGDFFNIETTSDAKTIVHTIDDANKLSGIKTDNKNVSLKTGVSTTEARDIIMADNAIDIGAATLSLTSYYGKSISAYSTNHVQGNGSITSAALDNPNTATVTVGNLNLTTTYNTTNTASIGGGGYTLKVAKGGEVGEANVGNNVLAINNESGDIAINELSAEHFKTIKVNYSSTDSTARAHTVAIDLFDNDSVTENLNYSDTGNGLITLDASSIDLSGFNRNFDLYAYYKDIQVNNIYGGAGYFNVTSYNNSITLNGDVNTNGGNISLSSNTFKLAGSSRIDSNADNASNTTSLGMSGSIKLNNSSGSRGVDISANTGVTAALTLDSSSIDGSGGSITTDMNATNSAGSYLTGLSFIGSGVTTEQDGSISLTGASFALNGDFTATGKVALSGGESTSSTTNIPGVTIDTNQSIVDSGDITFSGYSLSGSSSRNYVFNTSATGKGGNINLYPASTTGTFSAGSMTVNASGSTSSGTIVLPAVTTTKNTDSYTTTSAQSYTGSTITLNGGLQSNQANIDVLGSEVVLANDVSIDTYTGFVSGQTKDTTGVTAGAVTIGSTGAKLTNNDPTYSFAIDTSGNKGAETYAANNGSIVLRDSSTEKTTFNNFSMIGGGNLNTAFDTNKYSATGQVTIGQMDGGSFTWSDLSAGNLLLKGPANYTVSGNIGTTTGGDFVAGTLAATGVANLNVTTENALVVGSLSSVNGVSATGAVSIATKADDLTVNNNITTTSAAHGAITLNAGSDTDAGTATGGNVLLNANLTTGSGGQAIVYTGSIEDSGSYNFGNGHYRYNSDETSTNYTTALGTGNYAIYREQPTLTIGFASGKEYDGITLVPSTGGISGDVNNDKTQFVDSLVWNVSGDNPIKNAGSYTITHTGAVTGAEELGYKVSGPNDTYTYIVTPKALTVSLIDVTKVYDGNTTATLTNGNFDLSGFIGSEMLTVTKETGAYNSKNVANADSVTTSLVSEDFTAVGETLASNYVLPTTATGTGSITKRTLTASITDTPTKVYDGNTDATLTNANFSIANLVDGESFTVSKASGTYNDKDVHDASSVTTSLAEGDFTEGSDTLASNYTMPVTATGEGSITARTLTASIIDTPTKVYDGNTDATLTNANFSIANLVDGESFTVTKATGAYNDKDVVDASTVTTSLAEGDFTQENETLASNYIMPVTATGAGSITTRTLTASIIDTPTKVYDGNTDATLTNGNFSIANLVDGESFTVTKTTGVYNDKDVADANNVTTSLVADDFEAGDDTLKSNYNLPITATGDAVISVRSLVAIAKTQDKIFDAKTDAKTTLTIAAEDVNLRNLNDINNPLVVNGVVGNEKVFLTFTDASFSDEQVGINKTVTVNGLGVAGVDAANYIVMVKDALGGLTAPASTMTTTADINPNNPPVVFIPTPPPAPVVIPRPNLGNAPVVAVGGMQVVSISSTGSTTSVSSGGQGEASIDTILLSQVNNGASFNNQVFIVDGGINTVNPDQAVNTEETVK
uniref:Filamentous haemagglutinin family outer membrane protein n=2 Tax=Gammaproteobacteria TaxID=1236 RepID=A6VZU3_MARMS